MYSYYVPCCSAIFASGFQHMGKPLLWFDNRLDYPSHRIYTTKYIYMAPGLTNSLTVVSFTKDGISCSLLGEPLKEFSWESIQQISIVKSMCGISIGPHIRERYREYCVFSTRQLMEEEKSFTFLNASGQNSVAVIPYNEKLLKRIRSQYGVLYHHALIDAPVLIDSKSENHDSATTI